MTRILVLGAGQLGSMLAEAAARLGVALDRLSLDEACLYRGTSQAAEPVGPGRSAEDYTIITVEYEHLHRGELLERLLAHPGFANARAIAAVADRQQQKALLDRLAIPTSPWCMPHAPGDIERFRIDNGGRAIAKSARGGYDGRGQWRIDGPDDELPPAALLGSLIVERAIPFDRELSLVGARAADGETAFYPLVENHHGAGMLRCTVAPAAVDPLLQQRAEQMLGTVMRDLDYVGVMAMELFDTQGELLVNELAPRVHNSGHWTQAGTACDQFEQHLRALCGWPLARPAARGVTAMLNLIGTPFDPAWLAQSDTELHWYAKEVRAARKLGHINVLAPDGAALAGRLRALATVLDASHRDALEAACAVLERAPDEPHSARR